MWTVENFLQEPSRAGDTLERLLDENNTPGIQGFLLEYNNFISKEAPDEVYQGLMDGRLPQALLAVALDPRVYNPKDFERNTKPLVFYSVAALSNLIDYAVRCHPSNRPEYTNDLLEALPRLWLLFLERPFVLESQNVSPLANNSEPERMTVRFTALGLVLNEIRLRRCIDGALGPEILNLPSAHIILRCWLLMETTNMRIAGASALGPLYECKGQTMDHFTSFVDRAIGLKTLEPTRFMQRCNSTLIADKILDQALVLTLIALGHFCHHTQLREVRIQDKEHVMNLLHAAQRQVCHGEQQHESEVLDLVFIHILHIIPDDVSRFQQMNDFFQSLAMLLGRATVLAALGSSYSTVDGTGMKHIRRMIDFFALNCDYQVIAGVEGYDPRLPDFVGSIRQVWQQAYAKLKALPPNTAPHKALAVNLWVDLGRRCNIDRNASAPEIRTTPNVAVWTKDLGCAWRECLCFGERPQHKLRKCNGCDRVMYCSKKCQKRDWTDGGHRSMCCHGSSSA